MPYFPHSGRNENFCLKMGSVTFTCLLKPNSMEKIEKNRATFEKIVLQTEAQKDGSEVAGTSGRVHKRIN